MTGTVTPVDPPLDRTEFERWRREASGALLHAELAEGAELHNWACFSAEQAAQLAVKGLLHAVGAGSWDHDLQ
jgi:HEPN domain-containing protein